MVSVMLQCKSVVTDYINYEMDRGKTPTNLYLDFSQGIRYISPFSIITQM